MEVQRRLGSVARSKEALLGLAVVVTIGLVLGGQNNLSFSVWWAAPTVGLSGKTFEYSMWQGISKLLEQKSYGIAWLLILFSGIWPIVKLLSLLVVSTWPAGGSLTPSRRFVVLTNLCQFGRLSFMDVWVVCLIVLTVRIDLAELPGYGVAFWLQAVAEKGATLFLAAILISQIISNTLVTLKLRHEFSRRSSSSGGGDAEFGALGTTDDDDDDDVVVGGRGSSGGDPAVVGSSGSGSGSNVWDDASEAEEEEVADREKIALKDKFSLFQGMQLQSFLGVWSVLVVIALFTPCFSVTYSAAGENFAAPSYSFLTGLVTVGLNAHPETLKDSPRPGTLAVFGVLLVVIVPLLQLVLANIILFFPMRFSVHTTLHLWLDNLSHLSSMDTFALALVIVSSEVGTLLGKSELGTYCSIAMAPSGAFAFVAIVALVLTPLVRYLLLHHRVFLLEKAALRRPLLQ